MVDRVRTGSPEGSARETAAGVVTGVSAVLSRKKQREAPESSMKVCKASADVVLERADSLAPKAAASIPGALDLLDHLLTPGVVKAGEAAVLSVELLARLTSAVTCANDIRAATTTLRRPTLSKPLTKLLRRKCLTRTLELLLSLTSANASAPTATVAANAAPATTTAATAASTPSATTASTTTPTAATDATTPASTPATTPSAATTSSSTFSTTTPPSATSATLGSLALAAAAPPTRSRSSTNRLTTKVVNSSGSSVGGGEGRGRAPLKDGGARSATSSTYSDYASLGG
ncbi:unnamed protein product [Closterium sp. NIES-64]|nr:unnamed protein product [Closterium sp. NIES-64]